MKKPTPQRTAPKGKSAVRRTPAPRSAAGDAIVLKKILVPIDFSDHSKKAFRYALSFARQFNAVLEVMYVVEPTIYPSDFGFGQIGFPDVEKELHDKATLELQALIGEHGSAKVKAVPVVSTGIPFVEITTYAQAEAIDLIIIATHGRTGVEHILFGSTAEKIIRKSPCPVLVVRAEEHDFIEDRA